MLLTVIKNVQIIYEILRSHGGNAMMMEAVIISETSVYSNETTQRFIQEGSNLHPNHLFKTKVDTLQGIRWRQYFSVTLSTYESAWRHNPEEYCHHPKHRENLKSHKDDTRLLTLMFLLLTNSLEIKIVPNDVSSLPDRDKNLVIIRFIYFHKCACVAYQPQRETSFLDK
jgi:predicted SAM-dependent methyltransferase